MAPTESAPRQRRILCVDNYDSFVWTIVGYLRHLGAHVDVVRNDQVDLSLIDEGARGAAADGERTYDGVLVSPGPDGTYRCWECAWGIRDWVSISERTWCALPN